MLSDIGMPRHRANDKGVALAPDLAELFDAAEVNQLLVAGQPQLHCSQQGLATGKRLGTGLG